MADAYGALGARAVDAVVHRIVSSRFPPVLLFDIARSGEEARLLAELEGITNDRIRDEIGELHLVPEDEGVYGPGCTPIMAAFCHPAASRFSDGSFGIYYAALEANTAVIETVFRREKDLRDASLPPEILEMRRYVGRVVQPMTLLPTTHRGALLDPDDYSASRPFGAAMKARNVWGLYYESVRDAPNGRCVAALRPRALAVPVQTSHYRYYWNGRTIERVEEIQQYAVER